LNNTKADPFEKVHTQAIQGAILQDLIDFNYPARERSSEPGAFPMKLQSTRLRPRLDCLLSPCLENLHPTDTISYRICTSPNSRRVEQPLDIQRVAVGKFSIP
jgi:hypothetical protein